jgi:hypothetical protein
MSNAMPVNVLVLGAGASQHYQFPLARDLARDACELTAGSIAVLEPAPPGARRIADFQHLLRRSGVTSIDQFIEYLDDPELIWAGKSIMARLLASNEQRDTLTNQRRADHWYEVLANRLIGRTLETFPEYDIAIVTFNYERSLDVYLLDCLNHRFAHRYTAEMIKAAFQRLPLVHVYGQLGQLPELSKDPANTRAYGQIENALQLEIAINGMRLLREAREHPASAPNIPLARDTIGRSTGDIIFLGFAYSEDNLQGLDLLRTARGKAIRGTVRGMDGELRTELDMRLAKYGLAFSAAWDQTVHQAMMAWPVTILGKALVPS